MQKYRFFAPKALTRVPLCRWHGAHSIRQCRRVLCAARLPSVLVRVYREFEKHADVITAALACAITMSIYLRTMLPGLTFYDTGEFQTVTYVLGIAHPTGYPLYTMVGKIFGTLVPIGSFAFRMNLMSALCAAIAVSALAFFAIREGVSLAVSLAAALTFGFALNTWRTAGHADPYTLTAAIGVSLWLMALKWRDTGERGWLWTMALLSGLGLGSAMILAMELPAIILFALLARPREFARPATAGVAALLGVLSLVAVYSFLPLRAMTDPPLNYGNPSTWQGFEFGALSGRFQAANFLTSRGVHEFIRALPQIIQWYGEWFTVRGATIVAAFALIGLARLLFSDWRLSVCTAIGFLLPIYGSNGYPNLDLTRYYLLSDWLLLFAAAVGVETALVVPVRRIRLGSYRQSMLVLLSLAALALPLHLMQVNWAASDQHSNRDAEILAHEVLSAVQPNAVIFSWWGPSTALWYGRFVEGLRPDADIIDDSTLPQFGWRDATDGMAAYYGKRPIYTVPFWDQHEKYSREFVFEKVRNLHGLGQTLYTLVGRKPAASSMHPQRVVAPLTTAPHPQ